jgi:hypothetical protein
MRWCLVTIEKNTPCKFMSTSQNGPPHAAIIFDNYKKSPHPMRDEVPSPRATKNMSKSSLRVQPDQHKKCAKTPKGAKSSKRCKFHAKAA